MNAPLVSTLWYRVADLKPSLRSHARLHRHHYRGEVWHLLQDPASGRVHRFTPAARLLIGSMDGRRSVAALWEIANRRLGENAPTQDEVIQLLGQLHAADLLRCDVTPDVAELFARGERQERARSRQSFGNPMAIRLPFWDPDRFLNHFPKLINFIWGRLGAAIWLLTVLPVVFLIPPHWPELSNNFADHLLAVDNLFILYLVFPILKAFHELGHATATKAGGGEVHDMGVIFLVLLPVPYVEASAATTFRSKYRRAMVGAAGMAAELFLAALAFYVWLMVEQSILRAVMFNVMVVAGVSTLVFNGNPLLRYDAYYILADLTEIPNLAGRSVRYWGYLLERYIMGVRDAEFPHASYKEKAWFLFYGAASTVYRVIVTTFIALFIAGRFFFIGVLLALWAVTAMAILPLIKAVRHLAGSPRLHRQRTRAITVAVGTVLTALAFLFLVPIPSHTQAEGVVWLSEQSLVRAGTNGFLAKFLAEPGTRVSVGEPLVEIADPLLQAQLRVAEARVEESQATVTSELLTDRTRVALARDKLNHEQQTLAIIREKAADLIVHANADGLFLVDQKDDMLGRYYRKGEMLGHVIGQVEPLVRVVVPQDAIDRVRVATDRIRLRVVDHPDKVLRGYIVRAVPEGEEVLPSRALAFEGGGDIATDPRDTKDPKALQRMFQFDVGMEDTQPLHHFGQRVFVRFEHQEEPLSVQWYRSVRLLFLSRFSV